MNETILVLNAGSSSIKFQLFGVSPDARLERRVKGQMEGIGSRPRLLAKDVDGHVLIYQTWPTGAARSVPAGRDRVVASLRHTIGSSPTATGLRARQRGP